MDPNSGLPPEILVLCTTTETKERAIRLLHWIRYIPDVDFAREPAIPAICALIASEQLGDTVVTESRAQQWSQSTPEHFRVILAKVQKLLLNSRTLDHPEEKPITLESLVAEFCPDENAASGVQWAEKAFKDANGPDRWRYDSEVVQLSIFVWSCRQFKIRTFTPVEELQHCYNIPASDVKEINDFLDQHCLPTLSLGNDDVSPPCITTDSLSKPSSPRSITLSSSAVDMSVDRTSPNISLVELEDLAHEFGLGEDAMGGMRFLDRTFREREGLKDLVNWSSTMGRCAIFYWTCSVLKIPGAKHITLRTRYSLAKKDFDKILSALDLQRGELRNKLELFYAGNPASRLVPESTQWAATSPARPQYVQPKLALEKSGQRFAKKKPGKRGRPPKIRSPPPLPVDPASEQERALSALCSGAALRRALLLIRSFNARGQSGTLIDRIPASTLPVLVSLVASQQLGDDQISELRALRATSLHPDEFAAMLANVRASIDVFRTSEPYAPQTAFDDLALEHGLGIDVVVHMMRVREALKESRCLSVGMDWESPLVKCSVFLWTCAILKVPDVKQANLRLRSLVSKREFDSMLQLLNSHCTVIRHQLEEDAAIGACIFAPPPHSASRVDDHRRPLSYGELEMRLTGRDGDSAKRIKRETSTPSDISDALMEGRPPPSHGRSQHEGVFPGSEQSYNSHRDVGPIYIPTSQFPPPDWKPPESPPSAVVNGPLSPGVCPSSETGVSKRRDTRYSTMDYQNKSHDRNEVWKPDGYEVMEHQARYRRWEEGMTRDYGPHWETAIGHEKPGIPFE